jgi:hypothetical protein
MNPPKQYKKYMKTPTELFWIPQEGKGAHWSFDWKYHAVGKSEFDADRAEQVIQETVASRSRHELPVPIFESASCEESREVTNRPFLTSLMIFSASLFSSGPISIAVNRIPWFQLFLGRPGDRYRPHSCKETIDTLPFCYLLWHCHPAVSTWHVNFWFLAFQSPSSKQIMVTITGEKMCIVLWTGDKIVNSLNRSKSANIDWRVKKLKSRTEMRSSSKLFGPNVW